MTQPDDDAAEPDPVDAELIAYLDGELEPAAARKLEDRLDADPRLRRRADALKRSYDLLDFLPKPEPSPTFATRTMDKLPVSGARPAPPLAATTMTPAPAASGFSSLALTPPPRSLPIWITAAAILLAASAALGAGYLGAAAIRKYVFPPTPTAEPTTDSLSVADIRMLENLPLYAAVDDYDFLQQLASPEFFGDELASPDGSPAAESEKPSGKQLEDLFRQFRELPVERQEKIRSLDQQIHAQEPAKRDRSFRLLETYAAWLARLPEADRKEVFAAPSPSKRLEAIREVHRKQWIAALPVAYRTKLKDLPAEEKATLLAKWRAEEEKSRAEWSIARAQWDALRTGRQPWPFTDERLRKDVLSYVHAVYHPDDPKRNRLSAQGPDGGDAAKLKEALDRAEKGEFVLLGKAVHDFSKKYEMLPEPGKGNPIIDLADLNQWPGLHKFIEVRPKPRKIVEQAAGKWPEFALVVHAEVGNFKGVESKFNPNVLGPCRPEEYKGEVKAFLNELRRKASESEWGGLKAIEGTWPNHPREMIRLAKIHDLSVPGVMPPGPPSLWEKTYSPLKPMRSGG
jgi:hypothetical protein